MTIKPVFTLIELVLAFGIMALLATTTTTILAATLRSSARATVAGKVRNEGEYLMESISQLARYSTSVTCPSATQLRVATAAYLPSANITCSGANIASDSGQLNSNEVAISGCNFSCSSTQVSITFSVQDTNGLIAPLTFDSDIVLRNTQ